MNETNQKSWFTGKTALVLVGITVAIALLIYFNRKNKN